MKPLLLYTILKPAVLTGLSLACAISVSACQNAGNTDTSMDTPADTAAESEATDLFEQEDEAAGYVTINDGEESYDITVYPYGEEIELPESKNGPEGGEFVGWIYNGKLYQPKETFVSEEFMSFDAVWTNPNEGLFITLDPTHKGYSYGYSGDGEPFEVEDPYRYYYPSDSEDYFDYWADKDGNVYYGGEEITVENGDVKIVEAVYSTDYSNTYKVTAVSTNPLMDDTYETFGYVKKDKSITLTPMMEFEDYIFEGWFDAPEGGTLITDGTESYTPQEDITLYTHWVKE